MGLKRILVVDDSSIYQRMLSDVINQHPQMEVVGVASNGRQALEMVQKLTPDLVTLDILMPELDGIQTLMSLCKQWPAVRTIMVSSLTSEGSDAALDALALGANEYVAKPLASGGSRAAQQALNDDLLPKIEALCGIENISGKVAGSIASAQYVNLVSGLVQRHGNVVHCVPEIVTVGVSTGGPDALNKVLTQLPADLEVPVVIVQHMPAEFTRKLAARLDAVCQLNVKEAEQGELLQAGTIYIAPGDYHTLLERTTSGVVIKLNQNPAENSCRPSVDPLFRSATKVFGDRCLGVIMTGMGQDGLKGAEAFFAAGSPVIVQDEASSIVWGMPKLVALAGLAEEQVPLHLMAIKILDRIRPAGNRVKTIPASDEQSANSALFKRFDRSAGEV